jgi:SAM-dependent methyltransferase
MSAGPAPSPRHRKRRTCRLCDGTDLQSVLRLADTPIADAYVTAAHVNEDQAFFPLELYLCGACGHVQMLDVVDPVALFGDYLYTTSVSRGLVEHFRGYAREVVREAAARPGSLAVDIGSNDGTFLRFVAEGGLRVLGIDPAARIAAEATASGVPTVAAFFTSDLARTLRAEHGPATLVTANNVFAHADSLGDMAQGVRELLTDDGIFVFEVSYVVDIVEKMLFDTVYHEHLSYHSVRPLRTFLERHGLEIVDVRRNESKGGSLHAVAQRRGGPRPVLASVEQFCAREERGGYGRPETYRAFDRRIADVRSAVWQRLDAVRAAGGTIAGYGASHTVTTLLCHFELQRWLSFLVDDNPVKHHTFSPGWHIPVLPSQALYERRPQCVVVLAWVYAPQILPRHAAFRETGGRFLVPLPDVADA